MRTSGGEARSCATGARFRRGQSGQSLVEVIIAMVLVGSIFLILAGALFTVIKVTTSNKNLQSIDTGLITYGEILQTQVPYENCSASNSINSNGVETGLGTASNYQLNAEAFITGGGSQPTKWRLPYTDGAQMVTELTGLESWNTTTGAFEDRGASFYKCLSPDSGVQRVSYKITFGGTSRTGQVVKRKSCRVDQPAGCPPA